MHSLLFWHWNWNLPHDVDDFIEACVLVISAKRTPNGGIVDVVTSDDDEGLEMTVNIEIHSL